MIFRRNINRKRQSIVLSLSTISIGLYMYFSLQAVKTLILIATPVAADDAIDSVRTGQKTAELPGHTTNNPTTVASLIQAVPTITIPQEDIQMEVLPNEQSIVNDNTFEDILEVPLYFEYEQ